MSTIKKTELKVNINCERCKTDVLHAVTKLFGIDQVSVDAQKQILAVIGDVDPVMIVKQVRKAGKHAEIISVGPPKPPETKKSKKKPPKKSPEKSVVLPSRCEDCRLVAVGYIPCEAGSVCNIL